MTLLSTLDTHTQSQALLGSLDSSLEAFLNYSFEDRGSSLLVVTQDDEERLSLRVVDWTALSHFERLQHRLMGSASLEKIAYFVSVHFQRCLMSATQWSSFERQCALLQKKVKRHNAGLFIARIEFSLPYAKKQFTVMIRRPVVPDRLCQELQFTTDSIVFDYTPLSKFEKLHKRLRQWKHYVPAPGTQSSLPGRDVLIADWVASNQINSLTIEFSDVDLKEYIKGQITAQRDRIFQDGYHQGLESRRTLFG